MKKIFLCAMMAAFAISTSAQELNVGSINVRVGRSLTESERERDRSEFKGGDYKKYNGWDDRREALCDMINLEAFDVFGVQEARIGQINYMLEKLPDYAYIGVGRDDGKSKGEHCAIFYRKEQYNVLEEGTFWLSETPDEVSFGWGAKHRRICTWGLFQDKKTKVKFYLLNLHLDHRVEAAKVNGSKLVVDFVKNHCTKSGNIIITGDYNVHQDSDSYRIFATSGILQDSYDIAKYKFAPTGTFNGFNPRRFTTRRIDHIFLSKGIKVSRYGVLTYHYFRNMQGEEGPMETAAPVDIVGENRDSKCPTDHYPVQAWITLKGGKKR